MKWMILVLCVVVFGMSVFGGFIQDDRKVIWGNPLMGKLSNLASAWSSPYYWDDPSSGAYRPLTSFSLGIDGVIFGNKAWGFRLMNVVYYAWMCMGVFELARRLFKNEKWGFLTAALFALLPIHVEAVSNIVGRGELLSGGLAVWMMVMVMDGRWGLSLVLYFMALLAKESAIVWGAPWILMILKGRSKREEVMSMIMTLIVGISGYFLLRWGVLGADLFSDNATIVENPLKFLDAGERVKAGLGLVAFGVSKTLFPAHLSYDYSFNQLPVNELSGWWFGWGVVTILISILLGRSRNKAIVWGLAIMWLPIVVTGNILKPIGTIFGERLWLMPSLGIVIIIMELARRRGRWMAVGLTILLIIMGIRTMARNIDWLSEERLFLADSEYASGSVLTQNNAAAMWLIRNDVQAAKPYLDTAEKIYSDYPLLMNNWGIYYKILGDREQARERFEFCLGKTPGNILCSENLELLDKSVK